MDTISFSDFKKLEIRIGTITSAEKIEESERLLKLNINFGEQERQIVAGISEFYSPRELVNTQVPVILNMDPRKIMGVESQGMILAADSQGEPVLLKPEKHVASGSVVR
ncbi:MAG: methionine--tRNA ligase subunit beta [Elusimicrobiota bacterium]